jgi:hypothetical protein
MNIDTSEIRSPQIGLDPYQRFSTDPTRHKHHGNRESRAAWKGVLRDLLRAQRVVFEVVLRAHPEPVTPKEIARELGKPLHAISGRVTEGKELGILRATDIVRERSRAVALTEDWRDHMGL